MMKIDNESLCSILLNIPKPAIKYLFDYGFEYKNNEIVKFYNGYKINYEYNKVVLRGIDYKFITGFDIKIETYQDILYMFHLIETDSIKYAESNLQKIEYIKNLFKDKGVNTINLNLEYSLSGIYNIITQVDKDFNIYYKNKYTENSIMYNFDYSFIDKLFEAIKYSMHQIKKVQDFNSFVKEIEENVQN